MAIRHASAQKMSALAEPDRSAPEYSARSSSDMSASSKVSCNHDEEIIRGGQGDKGKDLLMPGVITTRDDQ